MKARRTAWAGVAALAAGVVLAAAMVGFARPAVLEGRSNREVADRMLQQRQRSRAGKAPRRNVPGAPSRSPAPAAGPGLASRVRAIEANAAAPQTEAAPSPLFHPGKHATGMTAQEAAEGTDQVFHDFSARDSSSARAGQASLAREEAKMAAELQTVRGRQQVPRGRGRALDTEEKKMAAEAHIYDADANIKVVDGTGGDDVASGIGAGVGDTWVTARKARIAADAPVPTAPPGANGVPRARRVKNVAASALPPRRGGLQHPRFFNNDVNVKVVAGTEGDGVASGLGASVGAGWVASRQARIAGAAKGRSGGVGQRADMPHHKRVTLKDINHFVGTNIVFHDVKNEGGILSARGARGIRYNDAEMY